MAVWPPPSPFLNIDSSTAQFPCIFKKKDIGQLLNLMPNSEYVGSLKVQGKPNHVCELRQKAHCDEKTSCQSHKNKLALKQQEPVLWL